MQDDTSKWWQAHSGHSRWLPGHEHLLQLKRRQRQSWRRPSWCRRKRSAALTSCPSQLRQAMGCWQRRSRRPQHLAGLRWLALHRPAHMQWQRFLHVDLTSRLPTAVIRSSMVGEEPERMAPQKKRPAMVAPMLVPLRSQTGRLPALLPRRHRRHRRPQRAWLQN
jgi:hypothetical protein